MLARLRSGRRVVLDRAGYEDDLDAELRDHLASHVEDLMAGGLSREEAERRARHAFGGVEAVKEACREEVEPHAVAWLRDLRHGFRRLAGRPGFTLVAVATLALCIGANAAVFGVVDAAFFRSLPYPEPERLARVVTVSEFEGERSFNAVDGRTWEAVRDHVPALAAAVYSDWSAGVNFLAGGRASHVSQQKVSAGFFRVLGVEPRLGRGFLAEEDREGGPAAVALSHELWVDGFASDPEVLGRKVTLRGEPYTVVGVLPEGFRSTVDADLWTPLRPSTTGEGQGTNYAIVARLRPGATWAEAEAQVRAVGAEIFADRGEAGDTASLDAVPLQEAMSRSLRRPLALLWAAVAAVLLIGCVNLAGLLLGRAAARRREIATRMAIGGGRRPIVRQLLAEGLALATTGGAAGLAVGLLMMRGLERFVLPELGLGLDLRLDVRVVAMTAGLSLLACLLFSAYPAWLLSRTDIRSALGAAGTAAAAVGGKPRLRRLLVVAEVALAVVLLVAAALLIRSFTHLRGVEPGFEPEGVVVATVSLQDARYRTAAAVDGLFTETLRRLEGAPGVASAGAALSVPYERPLNMPFVWPGHREGEPPEITNLTYVTPGYFDTLGVPLLAGRPLRPSDRAGAPRVALANRAFVEERLRDRAPVGARFLLADREWEIVGVVGDLVQRPGFGQYGPVAAVPGLFIPVAQLPESLVELVHGWFRPSWVVRTAPGDPGAGKAAVDAIRRAVRASEPALPLASVRGFDEIARTTLAFQRVQASLMAILAAIALLLAAVGLAGLISGTVNERQRELGIGLALGSTRGRSVRAVALPGVALTAAGLAAGALLTPLALRLLRGFLWGVSPTDPGTLASVAALLLLVALVASLVPALRIVRLDPARSLRAE